MADGWPSAGEILSDIVSRLPVSDPRVGNMAALLAGDFSSLQKASTKIADTLARGQPVTNCTLKPEADVPGMIDVLYAAATDLPVVVKPWASGAPMEDLYAIVESAVMRTSAFEMVIEQGSKLLANLRHFPISSSVRGLIAAQSPEYMIGDASLPILFFLRWPFSASLARSSPSDIGGIATD